MSDVVNLQAWKKARENLGLAAKESQLSKQADFGDRLQRIRASLDKINRLMADLKKTSTHGQGSQ